MGFSINPNNYYLKALFVIESCSTKDHIDIAKRCIDRYDTLGDYFIEFFKSSSLKPIVAHTGDYDHLTAMWILRKKLEQKEKGYDS